MEIKVPSFPESIDEGVIAAWLKQEGDEFNRDEVLVEIETDKVVLDVPASKSGTIVEINVKEGETVKAGQVIGSFTEGAGPKPAAEPSKSAAAAPAVPNQEAASTAAIEKPVKAGPAARRTAAAKGVSLSEAATVSSTKMVTKEDVLRLATAEGTGSQAPAAAARIEKRVKMTRLRASVAKRLVSSQQTAAMLTTFNEVNMQPVMNLRGKYKEAFMARYNGVKLGFMSFFVRAAIHGLTKFPEVNAYIEDEEIVYHNYADLGIAVSSERGLVVPVLRNAHLLGLAEIESGIADYAKKAQEGKLKLDELQGGTFTISNGGVFGSLLSTPIINPPQTAILGMHKIQERPVAVAGQVEILPMMYLALTYDHRMIDGKTAVQFLVVMKDFLENPGLVLLDL